MEVRFRKNNLNFDRKLIASEFTFTLHWSHFQYSVFSPLPLPPRTHLFPVNKTTSVLPSKIYWHSSKFAPVRAYARMAEIPDFFLLFWYLTLASWFNLGVRNFCSQSQINAGWSPLRGGEVRGGYGGQCTVSRCRHISLLSSVFINSSNSHTVFNKICCYL